MPILKYIIIYIALSSLDFNLAYYTIWFTSTSNHSCAKKIRQQPLLPQIVIVDANDDGTLPILQHI